METAITPTTQPTHVNYAMTTVLHVQVAPTMTVPPVMTATTHSDPQNAMRHDQMATTTMTTTSNAASAPMAVTLATDQPHLKASHETSP